MDNTLSNWLTTEIKRFFNESNNNSLQGSCSEKAWGSPLVGFSAGDDTLYDQYKKEFDGYHWTPEDIYNKTFSEVKSSSGDLTVICWILPQTEATKADQRKEADYPSERWVRARVYGDAFNKKVGDFVVAMLGERGYKAVCPMNSPLYEDKRSERFGFLSTWSERHAAFISGLGTFGLSDYLITPVGNAVRCGSVVSNIKIEPTKRVYNKYNEYCLFYANGSCMMCAKRCPAKAISENGHDKLKCRAYQRQVVQPHTKQCFDLKSASCGLCQFGVPCESGIPEKK